MNALDETPCNHPADQSPLTRAELDNLRCDAVWCWRCNAYYRVSPDRPAPIFRGRGLDA